MKFQKTLAELESIDDKAYREVPLQFAANRMAELVRIAESDPNRQVVVHLVTMNKLYMAYLGVLEVYQEQTAAGLVVDGNRFNCSTQLQKAISPLIQESRRLQAEKDIDREIELMKLHAIATNSSKDFH